MAHAFISYVRENSSDADRLAQALRRFGIDVWLDREQITAGERWQRAIRQAIRGGAWFLACFSRESTARERTYMNEELLEAIDELRLRPTTRSWFIPILLSPCDVPELPIGGGETLHSLQFVELYRNWDAGTERIVNAMAPAAASVKRYVAQLADPSARKRISAADALGDMGSAAKDAIEALSVALRDENVTVQAAATQAIGKIGTPTSEIVAILKQLVAEGDYYVRVHASKVLAMIGDRDAIPLLLKNLNADDARLRQSAASAIGLLGDAAAVAAGPLTEALRDENLRVRSAAADALASMASNAIKAIPELIRLLDDEEQWDRSDFQPPHGAGASDRASAARALGAVGAPACTAVPHLLKALFDSDSWVRCMAAHALGKIGDLSAIPHLERASKEDSNPQGRDLAVSAIRQLRGES